MKTKAIAEAKIKTDTLDARTLAHLLRSDLVAECYIAPKEIREDRLLLRLGKYDTKSQDVLRCLFAENCLVK